jgi:GNAT superfamily N-acetyltransferase
LISTSKDEGGKIVGIVEWRQVGQSGFDKYKGEYVWLQNLWIHPDYRGKNILQELIADVLKKAPDAKYGYFTREKYGERMSKSFKRSSVEAIVKKELKNVV